VYELKWEKNGRDRQATDDNVMLSIKDAVWMPNNWGKFTHTHTHTHTHNIWYFFLFRESNG